jgi:hypothetical protein
MITTPTAADLRAAIARRRIPIYVLSARVGIHPTNLSAYLNEREQLSPQLADRIRVALEACEPVERRSR